MHLGIIPTSGEHIKHMYHLITGVEINAQRNYVTQLTLLLQNPQKFHGASIKKDLYKKVKVRQLVEYRYDTRVRDLSSQS